jgi:hypothetical protein
MSMNYTDYLIGERSSERRHELIDGASVVVAAVAEVFDGILDAGGRSLLR